MPRLEVLELFLLIPLTVASENNTLEGSADRCIVNLTSKILAIEDVFLGSSVHRFSLLSTNLDARFVGSTSFSIPVSSSDMLIPRAFDTVITVPMVRLCSPRSIPPM